MPPLAAIMPLPAGAAKQEGCAEEQFRHERQRPRFVAPASPLVMTSVERMSALVGGERGIEVFGSRV